ncbi:MAG TPA: branched-chain amino acid ABC transporter permease [Thermoplasmata archaeon]|nr:branched-chain amino acid ABC transporter permease [Thermoplasmata archaeon]
MAIDTGLLTNFGFYAAIAIIFAILALGFNIQWGYTGLFNAGIAGFYLIGAYVAAIALTAPQAPIKIGDVVIVPGHWGGFQLPFVVAAILAMLASGATAALIAIPALRLRADYLAIATIAFAEILRNLTINLESFTGGAIGISFIPRPIVFNPPDLFLTIMSLVAIGGAILLVLLVVLQFMSESPWGRVLRATREDEEATMALGKNTFGYKLQAFALGGALMGLAGALSAVTLAYIEPTGSFAPGITFSVWVMVIVGGSGNNRGAILGAFLVYGMEWASVQLKDFVPVALRDTIFYIRFMIIGVLLILLVLFRPEGILREKKRALR